MTAARQTAASPVSEEIVEFATHSVTSTHHPYVEVYVRDALVATLRFELSIQFAVQALVAVVVGGRLVALRSGECDVTVKLQAEGREVLTRQAPINLALTIRLGDGIPLVPVEPPLVPWFWRSWTDEARHLNP